MPPKDFDTWNALKKHIDRKRFLAFVHAREVWWCSLGLNVGTEYAVIISQVRLLSTRRLRRRIFRMPEDTFGEVLSALQQMIGQGA